MSKKKSELVSTKEAAELLGVSKSRVDQFVRKGRLSAITIGNARLILRADVMAFKKLDREKGRPKKS